MFILVEYEFLHLAEQLATDGARHILKKPIDYEQLRKHLRLALPDSTTIKTSQVVAEYPGFFAKTSPNSI